MDEKRQIISDSPSDPSRQRATQSALYGDDVKVRAYSDLFALLLMSIVTVSQRRQVRNELAIEIIVRKRAVDGEPFASPVIHRLMHFSP